MGASVVPAAFWSQKEKSCGSDHHFGVPFASGIPFHHRTSLWSLSSWKAAVAELLHGFGWMEATVKCFTPSATLPVGDVSFGQGWGKPCPKANRGSVHGIQIQHQPQREFKAPAAPWNIKPALSLVWALQTSSNFILWLQTACSNFSKTLGFYLREIHQFWSPLSLSAPQSPSPISSQATRMVGKAALMLSRQTGEVLLLSVPCGTRICCQ